MQDNEYIVFCEGDSNSIDTWSNVPYFLTTTLEKLGIKIYRIDISLNSSSIIERFFLKFLDIVIRFFKKIIKSNNMYSYNRTIIYDKIVNKKMKKAIKRYPNADIISITFSHSGAIYANKQKVCMLCDWTIEYLIEMHQHRRPSRLERIFIKRQEKEILSADYVVTLFPDVQEYMEKKYNRKVFYLGNVINSNLIEFSDEEIIKRKYTENRYLFIGKKSYIKSAIKLVKVVEQYNKNNIEKIYVDIIGLNKSDDKSFKSQYVTCYGYLSKEKQDEKECYYEKVFNAKAIVNTAENWNGMSSLIETMYYDTPIVVVPNLNTIKTFGAVCNFGKYCNYENFQDIMDSIEYIQKCNFDEYKKICLNAHEKVKNFTWENYVKKINNIIKDL